MSPFDPAPYVPPPRSPEEARERVRMAREGEFYTLGEHLAQRYLEDDLERQQAALRAEGVAAEYRDLQARADALAAQAPPEVVRRAAALFERSAASREGTPFAVAAAGYLATLARAGEDHEREAAARREAEEARVLTDERIREMEPEEYLEVWDTKANRPREGYTYRPSGGGIGGGSSLESRMLADVNALAAGLGPGDVSRS